MKIFKFVLSIRTIIRNYIQSLRKPSSIPIGPHTNYTSSLTKLKKKPSAFFSRKCHLHVTRATYHRIADPLRCVSFVGNTPSAPPIATTLNRNANTTPDWLERDETGFGQARRGRSPRSMRASLSRLRSLAGSGRRSRAFGPEFESSRANSVFARHRRLHLVSPLFLLLLLGGGGSTVSPTLACLRLFDP